MIKNGTTAQKARAIADLTKVIEELPDELTLCKNITDDIARAKAWITRDLQNLVPLIELFYSEWPQIADILL